MTTSTFPHIRITGDPFERGVQLGQAVPERIRKSVAIYEESFAHLTGLSWGEVRERAEGFRAPIEDYDADIVAEMAGVAEGAGLDLEDLLAINARTEIMYGEAGGAAECTSLGARGGATATGSVLLAQNWDWRPAVADSVILLEVEPTDGPALLTWVEAGQVGKIGLNESGIGLVCNLLISTADAGTPGVPFHVILRGILNAGSFAEALAAITDANRCSSGNYLIASADGQMADVEGRPDGYDVIEPSDDMVWHANTFCGGLPAGQDRGLEAIPDSPVRTARIEELLRPVHGTLDVPTIAELLRDKQGAPSAICRAVDPAYPAVEQMSTMGSFIIDLAASTMHVAPGAPDELSHTPVTPGFAGRSLAR